MINKLQNILQEIDNGTRKNLYNIKFTVEELLSKDNEGLTFIENILKRNLDLDYRMKDIIKKCKNVVRVPVTNVKCFEKEDPQQLLHHH